MDPTQMYVSDGHPALWWAAFLFVAVVLTMALTGAFLIGVTRAYASADPPPPAPEPLPLDADGSEDAPRSAEATAAGPALAGVG